MFSCKLLQQSYWVNIENADFEIETFNMSVNERYK